MKLYLVIISIIVTSNLLSQSLPPINDEKINWHQIEVTVSDSIKNEWANKIKPSLYFDNYSDWLEDRVLKNYHLLDFNGDGLTDIIYNGRNPPGMEINSTAFFLNNGDSLICVAYILGDITQITQDKKQAPIQFQIIQKPCCSQFLFLISDYLVSDSVIDLSNETLKYRGYYANFNRNSGLIHLNNQYTYAYHSQFPKSVNISDTITLTKKTFFTPRPNKPENTIFDGQELAFHILKNKAISELQIGQKCIVLSKANLKNGDEYYFVMLKNESTVNNFNTYYKDVYEYGWIKAP